MEVENEVRGMLNWVITDATGIIMNDYIEADNNLVIARKLTEKVIIENLQLTMSISSQTLTVESEDDDTKTGVMLRCY